MKQLLSKLKKADKKEKKAPKPVKISTSKISKKQMTIIAVVAVVLIAGALVFYFKPKPQVVSTNDNLPKEVATVMEEDEELVEVLPASERMLRSTDKGFLDDPFEAPMLLIGVLQTGSGEDIATIRSGNIIYNVKEDDLIAGVWKVEEIYLDRIYLSSQDREIMLKLEK